MALALYALAAARTFRRPCLRVELHHLPTGEVVGHQHSAESLARHLSRAEAVAREAAAADAAYRAARAARADGGVDRCASDEAFPARPTPACRWCDFLRVCPEGSAQYRPARSWDALGEADR